MIPISDDNPARLRPLVTWALIALCVAVFFWQLSFSQQESDALVYTAGFVPRTLFDHVMSFTVFGIPWPWLTLFTSMFLHGGFLHPLSTLRWDHPSRHPSSRLERRPRIETGPEDRAASQRAAFTTTVPGISYTS